MGLEPACISIPGNFNIQQGTILLTAKNIPVPWTAARPRAVDGEFDRAGDVEFNEIQYSLLGNPKTAGYGFRL